MNTLSEDLVRATLVKDNSSINVEQWIYWNNSPLLHVPAATIQEFCEESFYRVLETNKDDHRARMAINSFLKAKLGWRHAVPWNPDDPLREVSLIKPSLFDRLARLAGALSTRKMIARIIDGSVVRQLRKEIGEDIIEFALLYGSSSKYFFTPLEKELSVPEDIVGFIKKEALAIVEAAFSAKDRGIQERIATKYPASFKKQFYDQPLPHSSMAEKILSNLWEEVSSWL